MAFPTSSTRFCSAGLSSVVPGQVVNAWLRPLLLLGLAAVITLLLLRSTVSSIFAIWSGSSTYSYGFVVIPISALLVWRRRGDIKSLRPTTFPMGLVLLALFLGIWVLANVADVQMVQQVALVGLLEALVWTLLGTATVRVLIFPLAFLFFTVPAGDSLVVPLQRVTAIFTVNALRFCGIPAVQDGFVFSTPSGNWKIAEACSGLRFLTSSLVVGVLVAGVAFRTWKRRIIFLLLSAVVPVLANGLRAFFIVVLAYFTSAKLAEGIDHIVYGWIFFSLVTAILIGVALRWREPDVSQPESLPTAFHSLSTASGNVRLVWCTAAAIAIIGSGSFIADALWSRNPTNPPDTHLWSSPVNWVSVADPEQTWVPGLRSLETQTLSNGSGTVSVFVGFDARKRRGVELVNSSNATGKLQEWEVMESGYRQTRLAGGTVKVAEYLLASFGQRRLVWMWYLSGDEIAAEPYKIKWMQAKSRLEGHPGNVLMFAISTNIDGDLSGAVANLQEFARGMIFETYASPLR